MAANINKPTKGRRRRQTREKNRFLSAYRQCGIVTSAAQSAGIGRRTHYDWLNADPKYAADYAEAVQIADDELLAEIRKRALDSDRRDTVALIVQLKMRGLFIERREVSGPDGGPQQVQVMTDEDKKIAERICNRRLTTVN